MTEDEHGGHHTYQDFTQMVVGDVGQLLAVKLGDYQLFDNCQIAALKAGWCRKGKTYCMATAQWIDVQESKRLVTLIELETGNFSC